MFMALRIEIQILLLKNCYLLDFQPFAISRYVLSTNNDNRFFCHAIYEKPKNTAVICALHAMKTNILINFLTVSKSNKQSNNF